MTTASQVAAPAQPARSPWFHSAPFDLLLILGVPFLIWPLVMAGQDAWGAGLLGQLILLTATGHYFATFVRAYGDQELFARFKVRFLVTPVVLLAVCVGMFATGNAAPLLLVTTGWAFWHWLAQAFGFARIYDIKVGSFRRLTTWLDKALVITGFVGAVTLNPGSIATFGKVFLDAGIMLPGPAAFAVIQNVVLGAMALVGIAYVVNLAWSITKGEPWSWQKQFMHVTTIGYYWFAFAYLPNVLVAYVLYELFHDVQYYAITWLTCRQRVRRPGVTNWLRWMFRPHWAAALVFVLVMSAFGATDALGRANIDEQSLLHQVWLGVVLGIALLHYYYDGFIWKARESALGADLGLQGGLRAAMVPSVRHVALWSLFFVPMLGALLFAPERFDKRQQLQALVAIAPGDFASQSELAFELVKARELPAALEHYRAAIDANPDYAPARTNYGAALDLIGDLDGAREQYEAALRCRDTDNIQAAAHLNLGVLLLVRGETAAAQAHFAAGAASGAGHPIHRLMGLAQAVPTDAVDRRLQLYRTALQLDPNHADAHLHLGNLLLARGGFAAAADHFTAVLRSAPDFVPALVGLASAQFELGRRDRAIEALDRALRREPGNEQALKLKARLGG